MKTTPSLNPKMNENPILLCYWFISNKHNNKVFNDLYMIQNLFGEASLRIVCLNPFNSQEAILEFKEDRKLSFEMGYDEKHTGLFYNINTYPSFLLMEQNGRILLRQDGYKEDGLNLFEEVLKNRWIEKSKLPERISEYKRFEMNQGKSLIQISKTNNSLIL